MIGSCTMCGKCGEVKTCAQCKTMRYCSKECQVRDWTTHKEDCKSENRQDMKLFKKCNKIFIDIIQRYKPIILTHIKKHKHLLIFQKLSLVDIYKLETKNELCFDDLSFVSLSHKGLYKSDATIDRAIVDFIKLKNVNIKKEIVYSIIIEVNERKYQLMGIL